MPSNSCTVKPVNDLKSSGFLDNRLYESKEGTNQYATMDYKAVFKLIMLFLHRITFAKKYI